MKAYLGELAGRPDRNRFAVVSRYVDHLILGSGVKNFAATSFWAVVRALAYRDSIVGSSLLVLKISWYSSVERY